MKLSKAAKIWIDYRKTHSKKNTVRTYRAIIERFIQEFGDGPVDQVTPEHILTFLNRLTEGNKPYTKRIRYSEIRYICCGSMFPLFLSLPRVQ